jgi:hypothetical protein
MFLSSHSSTTCITRNSTSFTRATASSDEPAYLVVGMVVGVVVMVVVMVVVVVVGGKGARSELVTT